MSTLKAWKKKVQSLESFEKTLSRWRQNGEKVVFTNGCFDLLHAGHVTNLSQAAGLGGKLIIAINSDRSVKRLKGPGRPLQNEKDRQLILASLIFSDAILTFDEDTPEKLIEKITPDMLVKGGDYAVEAVAGGDHVIRNGGSVVLLPLLQGRSTTSLAGKGKA